LGVKLTSTQNERRIKVPVLLGPTAGGKTEMAIRLSQEFGSEIVSCDSRQVYRFMDIGTAKPTAEEQRLVKHWMIDIVTPDRSFSCFQFARSAEEIIRNRSASGKILFICGGSGLYFKILSEGIGPSVQPCDEFRKKYRDKARNEGNRSIYEELKRVDPATASLTVPSNVQRNIRALEVYYSTGVPLSELKTRATPPGGIEFFTMLAMHSRQALYERINNRVDGMVKNGLFEEFKALRKRGYDETSPGMQCLGYKEWFAVENGSMSFRDAVETIKMNTRRYAKRQITWFKHQTKVHALLMGKDSFEIAETGLKEFYIAKLKK
jgi:tRNA dimethylallyltransferase